VIRAWGTCSSVSSYLGCNLFPSPCSPEPAGLPRTQSSFASRFALSTLLIGFVCLARRKFLTTGNWPVLLARGSIGGAAVLLYFYSISHAGAARGTLLNYTYPLWANLFAITLGKRPSPRFWLGLAIALVGIALILLPAGEFSTRTIGRGELAGLGSGLLAGIAVLTIKKLRETDESLTIVMSFSVIGLLLAAPFVDFQQIAQASIQPNVAAAAVAVALLAFLGHVFFTRGYLGATIQQATLLSLCVPLTACTAGILFLGEPLTPRILLGGVLLGAALFYSGRRSEKPKAHSSSRMT